MDFAGHVFVLTEGIAKTRKHFRLIEQLESCASSVAMNIAEGKGRNSLKEFIQFLSIARGSLFETVTVLEIIKRHKLCTDIEYSALEGMAITIAKKLNALIKSIKTRL